MADPNEYLIDGKKVTSKATNKFAGATPIADLNQGGMGVDPEDPDLTPLQKLEMRKKRKRAAELRKAKALGRLPGAVKEGERAALEALGAATEPGAARIRRQSAEQLAQAITATPRTGLGARLAAARGIGQRGLTAEADFRAQQKAREAEVRKGTAEKLAAAEYKAAEGESAFLDFESELLSPEEEQTSRVADALAEINKQLPSFDKFFTEDEEGAANMIRNVALRYKDTDAKLHSALLKFAQQVQDEDMKLEDFKQVTAEMLGM